jgi:hypothetical protein
MLVAVAHRLQFPHPSVTFRALWVSADADAWLQGPIPGRALHTTCAPRICGQPL